MSSRGSIKINFGTKRGSFTFREKFANSNLHLNSHKADDFWKDILDFYVFMKKTTPDEVKRFIDELDKKVKKDG